MKEWMGMRAVFRNSWVKIIVLAAILMVIFFVFITADINFSDFSVETLRKKIQSYGIWGPVVYIVLYQVPFRPASLMSAAAGAVWGVWKGFLILQIAANISAILGFLIARYAARSKVKKLIKGRLDRVDQAIEKHGFLTVLLMRIVPNLPWDMQNLGLGLTRVRFRDFVPATAIGIMPGSLALVYFGESFISVMTDPRNYWKILLAAGFFIGIFFLQKHLRKKKPVKK